MEKRRNFTAEQKAKIVIEALREEKTLTDIAAEYEVHPNQLSRWKAEFMNNASRAFSKETDEVEKVKQTHERRIIETNWAMKMPGLKKSGQI